MALALQHPWEERMVNIYANWMAQQVKNPPAMQETQKMRVWSLGQKNPVENEMATHTSILAWKTPWSEEPGGLQSNELQESDKTERLSTQKRKLLLEVTDCFESKSSKNPPAHCHSLQ